MKYRKLIILLVVGLLPVAIGIGQACTKSGLPGMSSTNSSLGIDNDLLKPTVDCLVKNHATGAIIDHITALTTSTSFTLTPPKQGTSIDIDCSKSSSADGSSVSLAISDNSPTFIPVNGLIYSNTYAAAGIIPIGIKITDANGLSSVKQFNLPITCDPTTLATQLAINPNALAISQGSAPGYLNISFAGVGSGGKGPLAYAIDLNGDGRFDYFEDLVAGTKQLYSTATSLANMYTLYDGTRNVGVSVYDTGCPKMLQGTKSVNFLSLLPTPQSGATAAEAAYFYLQANVNPLSGQADPADSVTPFNATEGPQLPPMRHVLCNYNVDTVGAPGTFEIKGMNTYDDGTVPSGVNPLLTHGMELQLSNITDAGGLGPYTSSATVDGATYQTAAAPDGAYKQYLFGKNSTCTASVTIKRAQAVAPCTNGAGGVNEGATIITGTFSCPDLRAPASGTDTGPKDVSLTNGYFFCQVDPTNQCVGGGGQGQGGQPPPQF